jgi:hypothetical protein
LAELNPALFERLWLHSEPVAHPDSVLICGQARFTVLTPRLIRLEWSSGGFEDRATFGFPTRYNPQAPKFETHSDGGFLTLKTGALTIRYTENSGKFTPENLQIEFELNGETVTWRPGTPATGNLRGTRRTVDGVRGQASLQDGFLSRDGWVVVDDSDAIVFDPTGWVTPRTVRDGQDWYFFGYGHAYKDALSEYMTFGGAVPLIPRYVLGAWWSRYWEYSENDLRQIVTDFEAHDLPLDVLVIDMDWHTPDGWTGYTWNKKLFPDPPGFLSWVHERGLRSTLNLHPADGVQPHEEVYPQFATAMGIDPATKQPVPFAITNKNFVQNYFELLHHKLEDEGVDFWWMDWQQGEKSEMDGLDPLAWLNHLHFHDSTRRGNRPMLYSRWGGKGAHRYHIGFSGDSYAEWEALAFLPYLTATSSNILYGWWSHDIGGHFGATEPELFARWVQFGAVSPCLRLHATKDPLAERRPWTFPQPVFEAAREAFHLRYALVPYVYTMARKAADTGVSLCRPMYYENPESEAAYLTRDQYYFGDDMIAAPVISPANSATGKAVTPVWLPDGEWVDFFSGKVYAGGQWLQHNDDLNTFPLFVRAGSVIPFAPKAYQVDKMASDALVLHIYAGGSAEFTLYEDDGASLDYTTGQFERTTFKHTKADDRTVRLEVLPTEGRCEKLAAARRYTVHFVNVTRPATVRLNGAELTEWSYDEAKNTLTVEVEAMAKTAGGTLEVSAAGKNIWQNAGGAIPADLLERFAAGAQSYIEKMGTPSEQLLSTAEKVRQRLTQQNNAPTPFYRFFDYFTPEEARGQLSRLLLANYPGLHGKIEWTLERDGQMEVTVQEIEAGESTRILASPFRYEGERIPLKWSARLDLHSDNGTQQGYYESRPLFVTIPLWHATLYKPGETVPELQTIEYDPAIIGKSHLLPALDRAFFVSLFEEYHKTHDMKQVWNSHFQTTVISPLERQVRFEYWSNGGATLTLNGQVVPPDENVTERLTGIYAPGDPVRYSVPVTLRAGTNALVVEIAKPEQPNDAWKWAFSVSVIGANGQTYTDFKYE